jgi:hypothetical protein
MPLAEQLRSIERDRDALLDRMELIISAAEREQRGFSDEEARSCDELKRQVQTLNERHKTISGALEVQKLRAMQQEPQCPADILAGEIFEPPRDVTLRAALRFSGFFGAIQRSGNLTGRGTLRINAKTLLTGTAAPGVVPKHADLGATQAQFGSTPLLGSLAFVVPVNGGIVTYSRIKIGSGAAAKQVPEGSAKAHVVLAGEPILSPIATYAAWEKVSTQSLSDVEQLLAVVEAMLSGAVLDLISADIYLVALAPGNSTPFVPAAGDVAQDSIIKAAAAIAATGASRVTVGVNPMDFASMATAKAQGGGGYLGVSPMMAMPAIIQSAAIPAGKLLASASDGTGLCFALRSDLDVAIGVDADDFTKNLRTALAEGRGLPFVRVPARVMTGDLTAGTGVARSSK